LSDAADLAEEQVTPIQVSGQWWMKILVDENIPRITVERLPELGHDVRDVRRTPDQGVEDAELWKRL
jgi:hypothetical protein